MNLYLLAMRRAILFALVWGFSLSAALASGAGAEASPRQVVERFDSLMEAGNPQAVEAARALTVGPARRLFPLLAEAQARLAPFLDTALSRDTILAEARRGDWVALEIHSEAVFHKPFLGMRQLESRQAVHLFHDASGWRIADFEELAEGARAAPRAGVPSGVDEGSRDATLLPVSTIAPEKNAMRRVTRMRVRVSLRSGDSLALPSSTATLSTRRVMTRGASWAEVETRVPVVSSKPSSSRPSPVYLASTPDLDLSDPLLRQKAAELKKSSPHAAETTRRIHRFVMESFEYRLGATLFATSREALRDRKGDCSEAAVLVAALLRAAGIPSRVVLGYATLERGVWIGHAWAEAWLGGEWVGVDAALREFPAGASRVALLTLSGERPMKPEATNLMIRTLSNLDIQITAAWAGDSALPLVAHPGAHDAAREFWDKVLEGVGR